MFPFRVTKKSYPDLPPSLHAESVDFHEKRRPEPLVARYDTAGSTTPYLGLRSRLSQVWLNRWTVLTLLVLVRVLILIASLNTNIGDAKTKALAACTKVEDIGSAMASMPHYLSVGVNDLAAAGIQKSINAMVDVLLMILTAVQEIIFFVINFYVGTYACLVAALIHGGLDVAVSTIEGTTKLMNTAVDKIADGITDDVKDVQDAINKAFDTIKDGVGFFGGDIDVPKIDLSGRVNDLKKLDINTDSFTGDLKQLNEDIPTFDEVAKAAKDAIATPFKFVKEAINSSSAAWAFDKSVFPVAEKEKLDFCSNNSKLNDFFEGLFELASKAKIGFIVVCLLIAILICIPYGWWEIQRWRRQKKHAEILTTHGYDPMDVVYIVERSFTARMGIKMSSKLNGKRQLLVRWLWAYSTSLPALFILSLALAGLFSCLCQVIMIRAVEKEVPKLADEVGDFANEIVTTLQGVSTRWANDANGVVENMNDKINNDVLGYVTNATDAVNDTLAVFSDKMNEGLDKVFKDTPLYDVVKDVVRCLIGLKIEAVEKGLTWVHDHAHVNFPLFPNDTFSTGAQQSINGDSELTSFLASPSSVSTDEVTGAVQHVVNFLYASLFEELYISVGLLLVYVIVVLMGTTRALAGMLTPDRTRGDGGQRFVTADPAPVLGASPGGLRRAQSESNMRFAAGDQRGGGDSYGRAQDDFYATAASGKDMGPASEKKYFGFDEVPMTPHRKF